MGSIKPYETSAGRRYKVQFRKPDRSTTTKRGFPTKRAAQLFLAQAELHIAGGTWIDGQASRVTVAELGPPWLAAKAHLKPSSFHVLDDRVADPRRARLGRSDRRVDNAERDPGLGRGPHPTAQRDGRHPRVRRARRGARAGGERPADRAVTRAEHRAAAEGAKAPQLSDTRAGGCVERGSAGAPDDGPAARLHRAALGRSRGTARRVRRLRAGAAARPGQRGERRRARSSPGHPRATTPAASRSRTSSPRGCRYECARQAPGDLVFGAGFDYLPTPTHKDGWFAGARRRSVRADSTFPPKLTIHDLRHTAASLAISAGANVKAVQRMLGHASAAMTLDTYADLFEDDLDAVASALDQARASSVAVKTQSRAGVSSPDDPQEARNYGAEQGKKKGAPGGSRTPNRFLRTELLFH